LASTSGTKSSRLELIAHGEVVARETVTDPTHDILRLRTTLRADRSIWMAVRAFGERDGPQNMIVAHSAPIYVIVDDQPFWKLEAVPEIVKYQLAQLDELLTTPIEPNQDLEPWETRTLLAEQWEKQRGMIRERVEEAKARYEELLARARQSMSQ
jgi:hypothetical protein